MDGSKNVDRSTFEMLTFGETFFGISILPTNSHVRSVNILYVDFKVNIFYLDFSCQLSKIALF